VTTLPPEQAAHRCHPGSRLSHPVGIARAQVKIGLANLADNIKRRIWLSSKAAPA
jgi:hypothetical protein